MADSVFQVGSGKDFVVFNNGELSMEPVTDDDIRPVDANKSHPSLSVMRSQAWSCNVEWFFIIGENCILLLNVYTDRGFVCRKKSAMFIQAFLDAPGRKKQRE
jgi:hypothetical protein